MAARRRSDFTARGRENSFRGCWSTAPCPHVRARRVTLPKTLHRSSNGRQPAATDMRPTLANPPLLAVADALIVPLSLRATKQLAFGKLTIKAPRHLST